MGGKVLSYRSALLLALPSGKIVDQKANDAPPERWDNDDVCLSYGREKGGEEIIAHPFDTTDEHTKEDCTDSRSNPDQDCCENEYCSFGRLKPLE